MLMMEPARYPSRAFTSAHVRRRDMHLWTGVQLLLFGILYVVKTVKAVAIAFPLVIAACIPIRIWVLPKLFDRDTLVLLDGDDDEVREMLEKKDEALRCDDDPSVHEAPAEKAAAASEGAGDGEVGVVVKS